jgi:N-acetyl-anhydromuramyl-L-alanine amidase AmpD
VNIGEPRLSIIVRGQPYRCLAPVRTWHATGLHFLTRTRRETRWIVNHWTASENAASRVFESLRSHVDRDGKPEPLSVHFIVDQLGEIYQCADTEALCAHALGGNTYGIGIEIVNRGDGGAPDRGFDRPKRTEMIHGRMCTYGEFYAAQVASVVALNAALAAAYSLPLRVPMKGGDVFPGVLEPHYLAGYRGVLGHLHISAGKRDPGLELLRRIHAAGAAVA